MIDLLAHAKAIETLYDATATVYGIKNGGAFEGASPNLNAKYPDMVTPVYVDVPCYFETESAGAVGGDLPQVAMKYTLICPDTYDIPEGATIKLSKYGHETGTYKAGVSDHRGSHQEINLQEDRLVVG